MAGITSCKELGARIAAAGTNRAMLGAVYVDAIGYNPFDEDPAITETEVLATLINYALEWAFHLPRGR